MLFLFLYCNFYNLNCSEPTMEEMQELPVLQGSRLVLVENADQIKPAESVNAGTYLSLQCG